MVWVFRGKSRSGATTTVINQNLVAADPNAWIGMDVAAVSVALDWRARTRVQQELATLARKGTADNLKLLSLLSRSSRLLLDERDSWIYAGVRNFTQGSTQSAEANFRATAAEFRTRFRRELVRSTDGKKSEQAAPDLTPLAREGTGVAVVTVVLAARDEIVDVLDKPDAAAVAALLLEICALPFDRFVAFEVIWSPAADADRMSSAELELFYPELVKLESPIRVGTVACAHCRARFAAELGKCPECGAPL